MGKKRGRGKKNIYPTSIPDVKAVINCTVHEDGTARLSGYLVDARTHVKLNADIKATTTAVVRSQIPDKERMLIGKMTEKYLGTAKKAAKIPQSEHPYADLYQLLSENQRKMLCPPGWHAETTIRQGLAYFTNTMLPILDSYGLNIDAIQQREILNKIKEQASSHKNSKGTPLLTGIKINQHAKDFNYMCEKMRLLFSDYALPEIELPVSAGLKNIQIEQCKALPVPSVIQLSEILMRCIGNGLAMGAVLMLTTLVRTAEACAPLFKDIVEYESYAVYGVLYQKEEKIKIPDLKTDASYRIIILPMFAVRALNKRKEYLMSQGYTEEQILEMPVVSAAHNPETMATPNDLSAYVRTLLELVHCGRDYWKAVDTAMQIEPDQEHNKSASTDPSAYVLRRNGCSILCNYCGMDPNLVDALMGHALPRSCKEQWDRWIRRPDNWPTIARYYERFVYAPEYSANPAYAPIQLKPGMRIQAELGEISYQIEVPADGEAVDIVLNVKTMERGDDIEIHAPDGTCSVFSTEIQVNTGEFAPILGPVYPEEYYTQMRQTVDELDLGKFL